MHSSPGYAALHGGKGFSGPPEGAGALPEEGPASGFVPVFTLASDDQEGEADMGLSGSGSGGGTRGETRGGTPLGGCQR